MRSINVLISNIHQSAEKLRMKSGKTMMALSAGKGISKLLLKRWKCVSKAGESIAAVVLPDLRGKGQVRQRSLTADKHFWLLLMPQK
jgi:hypothetical protein